VSIPRLAPVADDNGGMADTRADRVPLDTAAGATASSGVQAMWREQNAAFRARVMGQLRQTRQRDEKQPLTA
jgi:hypothetical protein